jgi:hypothetical protein
VRQIFPQLERSTRDCARQLQLHHLHIVILPLGAVAIGRLGEQACVVAAPDTCMLNVYATYNMCVCVHLSMPDLFECGVGAAPAAQRQSQRRWRRRSPGAGQSGWGSCPRSCAYETYRCHTRMTPTHGSTNMQDTHAHTRARARTRRHTALHAGHTYMLQPRPTLVRCIPSSCLLRPTSLCSGCL